MPHRTAYLGLGIHDDQVIWAEQWDGTWQIVLEENGSELARIPIDACGLMDIVLGVRWTWYQVELRAIKGALQVKVSGELFAMLPERCLSKLTTRR